MPMVRHREHHRINVWPRQQLTKIVICSAIVVAVMFVDDAGRAREMTLVHVARRDHLAILSAKKSVRVRIALVAATHHPQGDALRGRGHVASAQNGRLDETWDSKCSARDRKELTSRKF